MTQVQFVQDLAVVLAIGGAAAWLCQRLGISVVVGYLLAGIVVGPFTPPFTLVTDLQNIHTLANLGLILVLFFVGLGLGVPRMRQLGGRAIMATALTALLVLTASRTVAGLFGFSATQSLFLAGALMVSSSAIISKVLDEQDATRQPHGQLSLGVTVLEDVVAVAMLAVLGALGASKASGGATSLPESVGRLAGFVLVVVVGGMLVVPRLLARLRKGASPEVQTIVAAGLLLGISWLAAFSGYSLALGAFLIGSVIGGTPYRARLEQSLEGMRDLFAAVFFVSMGMLFDVSLLLRYWPLALGLSAFALVARLLSAFTALSIIGLPAGPAARSASLLIPLGEFSFVIAQLGVSTRLMPEAFYPAVVGAGLVTTLVVPVLARGSDALAGFAGRHEPQLMRAWREFLSRAGANLRRRRAQNPLTKLLPGRLLQLAFEVALIASAMLLSQEVYAKVSEPFAGHPDLGRWLPYLYWTGFGLLLLVPVVAVWRNLGVLGLLLAEAVTGPQSQARVQPLLARSLQMSGALVVLVLCLALLPPSAARPAVLLPILALGSALALLLRSRLVRWYSRMQVDVREQLAGTEERRAPALRALSVRWDLRVHEHELSDLSPVIGRTLAESGLRSRFGCAVVGIDRQGLALANPSPDVVFAPGDRLLLVGGEEQIEAADAWLRSEGRLTGPGFDDLVTGERQVPEGSPAAGKTLAELAISSRFGVMILATEHQGQVTRNPSGSEVLAPGDSLLVLGTAEQHEAFGAWLEPGPTDQASPG